MEIKVYNSAKKERADKLKNKFGDKEGLPVRINLYIIKFIYYEMKKDRAKIFNEKNETGKKLKAIPIFSTKHFPLSRQRFDRINRGIPFRLTNEEAKTMADCYGIDIKYFTGDEDSYFKIQRVEEENSENKNMPEYIDEISWKYFYKYTYSVDYFIKKNKRKISKEIADLEYSLKELVANWRSLKQDDPLFAICYYFHYNASLGEKVGHIERLKECLQEMDISEWDNLYPSTYEEIFPFIEKHYQYLQAIIRIIRLRKKK